MAVFKHTRGGYYQPSSPSANLSSVNPSPVKAPNLKRTNEGVDANKPGFFSTSSDLGDPIAWKPGFITEISGNRFSMKGVNGETGKYPFFIPANEFDPENNYKNAQNNVYQVIFGSNISKRAKVNVAEVSNLPDSFKKWAELKQQRSAAPVVKNTPTPRPCAPVTRPMETPSEIQISPDFTLKVGNRYLFSNNPNSLQDFRNATLLTILPDRMVTTDGDYTFVIDPSKARRDDWKKYLISTKRPTGAPEPPHGGMLSQPLPQAIEQKKEGKAGIDRELLPGDEILVSNDINFIKVEVFAGVSTNEFRTYSGNSYTYAIPKDIVDEVGQSEATNRFVLKVVNGEIKAFNA